MEPTHLRLSTLLRHARRLAAVLAAAVGLAAAAPAAAEPALWVIKDADSTIYLFGTVHVLKPQVQWRSAKVDAALAQADELVTEIRDPDDAAAAQPLIRKYGIDPTHPLSTKLPAAEKARVAAAVTSLGLPPTALEPFRPWMAALTLTVAPLVKAGYDPKSGVDTLLLARARADGKGLGALETMEQQLRFFADLPPDVELAFLKSTLDDIDEGPGALDRMVEAWAAGDTEALEAVFVTEMRRDYPALYEKLVVERNRDWAMQLKDKLAGRGVSFVAVGAGHLVGPDSVQADLRRLGVVAERK